MPVKGKDRKPNARDVYDAMSSYIVKSVPVPRKGESLAVYHARVKKTGDPLWDMLVEECAASPSRRDYLLVLSDAYGVLGVLNKVLYQKWS